VLGGSVASVAAGSRSTLDPALVAVGCAVLVLIATAIALVLSTMVTGWGKVGLRLFRLGGVLIGVGLGVVVYLVATSNPDSQARANPPDRSSATQPQDQNEPTTSTQPQVSRTLAANALCPSRSEFLRVGQLSDAQIVLSENALPPRVSYVTLQMRVVSTAVKTRTVLITICQEPGGQRWYFSRFVTHEQKAHPQRTGLLETAAPDRNGSRFKTVHTYKDGTVTYLVDDSGVTALNEDGTVEAGFMLDKIVCLDPTAVPRPLATSLAGTDVARCTPGPGHAEPWDPK
jgi:hypothetical protein